MSNSDFAEAGDIDESLAVLADCA